MTVAVRRVGWCEKTALQTVNSFFYYVLVSLILYNKYDIFPMSIKHIYNYNQIKVNCVQMPSGQEFDLVAVLENKKRTKIVAA